MQAQKSPNSHIEKNITHISNNIVGELRQMGKLLKSSSKNAYQANNSMINQLLLVSSKDIIEIVDRVLTHLIQVVEFKGMFKGILSILGKIISLSKIVFFDQKGVKDHQIFQTSQVDIDIITKKIVDIVFVVRSKVVDQDMTLRIVQTAYSLIEPGMLQKGDYSVVTRLYSIFLKCCSSSPLIQNISASAIFALTQIISLTCCSKDLVILLTELLEFTIQEKKCEWLIELELRSITWDVILIAVKAIESRQWDDLGRSKTLVELFNEMYKISMENSFPDNPQLFPHDIFKNCIRLQSQKSHGKRDLMWDYVKCYKVFIFFSLRLSVKIKDTIQIVPFRKHLDVFRVLFDYQKTTRFYIILEGISLLIKHGSEIVMEEDGGIMLIDIFQKICQELYSSKMPFQITWETNQLRLEKIFDDFGKITDEDYLKLTKNTLINLRKGLENSNSLTQTQFGQQQSLDVTNNSLLETKIGMKESTTISRWRKLIKSVIRIIRYLTSLKFKEGSNDQALRKFIMELQSWLMICPNHKTQNAILFELQSITNNIESMNQAIKASQCMQICSNILYGFYDRLNSVGISIVIRILANIKICFEQGKDFNQLDEVSSMADKFYIEQKLIGTEEQFKKTVQGFVQSINLMIADMQVPKGKDKQIQGLIDKYLKVIDYVLVKLKFVIEQNIEYMQKWWNFVECFWVSLCSNKIKAVRSKIIVHIKEVSILLLREHMLAENDFIHFYSEISKFQFQDLSVMVTEQIKLFMPLLKEQNTLVSIVDMLSQLKDRKYREEISDEIEEVEEMFIKEYLFKITLQENLLKIIQFFKLQGNKGKNQQYKTVSLFWNISDHLWFLYQHNKDQKQDILWTKFFQKINQFTKKTSFPGTRQACIHTFTQTMATCFEPIGRQLFLKLLVNQYLDIFGLLMDFDEELPRLEVASQVEMCKMGIKNFIKLSKKCISDKHQQISVLFQNSIKNLTSFMEKKGNQLPIQYFIELLDFFQFFKELESSEKDGQEKLFELPNLKTTFEVIERGHQHFDKTTYYWKKKYQPAFIELKNFFEKQ